MIIPWLVSLAALAPAQVWGKVQYDNPRVASTGVYDRQLTSYRVNCATSRVLHLKSLQYKGQTLVWRNSGFSARRRWSVAGSSSLLDATIRTACRVAGNPATP